MALLAGAGIFIACLLPFRALMNYHEEHHLFRWTSFYLHEQWSSWEGIGEFFVSFITQFFYIGWLGAIIMALLVTGVQLFFWFLMTRVGIRNTRFYPLSILPAYLLFFFVFVPERYRQEPVFREVVEYDYLVRSQQWDAIVNKPATEQTVTDLAVLSTNYALAMHGQLPDFLFFYRQTGLQGLFDDGQQEEVLSYFTLSDIFLRLGMVNNAERMAFDLKQYIPHNHKSGRIYRRLAETNLINGNYTIAVKYLKTLKSTLFYGKWANKYLEHINDETYINQAFGQMRGLRLTEGRELISPQKDELLLALVRHNQENKLAWDYLLAYALLQLNQDKVAHYMQLAREAGYGHVPRAVQECLLGNRMLHREEQPPIDFKADDNVETITRAFITILNESRDMNNAQLSEPPFSQTYWYYQFQTIQKRQSP